MFNTNQYFVQKQIPFFNIGYDPNQTIPNNNFCLPNIANPFLAYLQQRFDIIYMISNADSPAPGYSSLFYFLNEIALDHDIAFTAPPNTYTLTDADKIEFLSYIGNIVGLAPFSITENVGFILNVSKLDLGVLGDAITGVSLSPKQYANILLARFYKFYSNCSVDNIINTIQLVCGRALSDISLTISGVTMNFNITVTNDTVISTQSLLEYTDPLGYNLWMKPSYGIVKFTYTLET